MYVWQKTPEGMSAEDFAKRANPDYLKYATEQAHAAGRENGFAPDIIAEIDKLKQSATACAFNRSWMHRRSRLRRSKVRWSR